MAIKCWGEARGKRVRLTRENACGTIQSGANGQIVLECVASLSWEPETDTSDAIELRNMDGGFCDPLPGCETIKWLNVTMVLNKIDPTVFEMAFGWPLVLDGAGDTVGYRFRDYKCDQSFGIEAWSDIRGAACGATAQYGYTLLAHTSNWTTAERQVSSEVGAITLTGRALRNNAWGAGPYNVVTDALLAPSPLLVPLDPNLDFGEQQLTTVAPPAAVCGAQTLTPV